MKTFKVFTKNLLKWCDSVLLITRVCFPLNNTFLEYLNSLGHKRGMIKLWEDNHASLGQKNGMSSASSILVGLFGLIN